MIRVGKWDISFIEMRGGRNTHHRDDSESNCFPIYRGTIVPFTGRTLIKDMSEVLAYTPRTPRWLKFSCIILLLIFFRYILTSSGPISLDRESNSSVQEAYLRWKKFCHRNFLIEMYLYEFDAKKTTLNLQAGTAVIKKRKQKWFACSYSFI